MFPLRKSESSRHDRASRMRLGDGLEIVGLVGMGAHGVGQRCVDRRGPEIGPDEGGLRIAAEAADIFQRHDTGVHARARHHGTERIENAVLTCQHHLLGQLLIARSHHVPRQPFGDTRARRAHRAAAGGGHRGNRSGGLQETAA